MKKLILYVMFVFCFVGCKDIVIEDHPRTKVECQIDKNKINVNVYTQEYTNLVKESVPYLDLPQEFRVQNYGGGSCVHASMETLFYWQGLYDWAKWWRENYSGGEYADRLHARLDAADIRFAYTKNGDWKFLEKCIKLRLGCAINWPSRHMVTLVGMDENYVYILDNNDTHTIIKESRKSFDRVWTGWAVTIVYTPPPPQPY